MRTSFDGRWVAGFEIAEIDDRKEGAVRVWLRRRSDRSLLPVAFDPSDVRTRQLVKAAP